MDRRQYDAKSPVKNYKVNAEIPGVRASFRGTRHVSWLLSQLKFYTMNIGDIIKNTSSRRRHICAANDCYFKLILSIHKPQTNKQTNN